MEAVIFPRIVPFGMYPAEKFACEKVVKSYGTCRGASAPCSPASHSRDGARLRVVAETEMSVTIHLREGLRVEFHQRREDHRYPRRFAIASALACAVSVRGPRFPPPMSGNRP